MTENITFLHNNVTSQKLLCDLILQVQKDLQTTVDSDIVLQCTTPEELVVELSDYLYQILNSTNVARFSVFLYRVDVREDKLKALEATDVENYVQKVVFLVLQREFLKVYLKDKYSE